MKAVTIFDISQEKRSNINFFKCDIKDAKPLSKNLLREKKADIPEASELDIVRHYTNLSNKNFSIDKNFYPLGSCTMKYNPKAQEKVANLDGFLNLHPHLITNNFTDDISGSLQIIKSLEEKLCKITGMDSFTTSPQAGAHGEMLGIMMINKYHKKNNNINKKYILVPDSSHGTNPATASMVGYKVITIKSNDDGEMDFDEFKKHMNENVAAVMLTVPNTLGIFNKNIKKICDLAHSFDALMYYDGANMNAILGIVRPGDIGFDVMHVNLHKTFGTPHGGGGPGSGPVGVKKNLIEFLPDMGVNKTNNKFILSGGGKFTVGKISPFFGNFGISLRALCYINLIGKNGMINVSKKAVLNANYIKARLKDYLDTATTNKLCMHECVFCAKTILKKYQVSAMDIAKYLLDFGIHSPTVYFPLNVKEAIMIEPTETESKETIDYFCDTVIEAIKLAKTDGKSFKNFPKTLKYCRADELLAIKQLDVRYNNI